MSATWAERYAEPDDLIEERPMIPVHCTRCNDVFQTSEPTGGFPLCPICTTARKNLPYPVFCSMPDKCAGKSYCQRERCCAD